MQTTHPQLMWPLNSQKLLQEEETRQCCCSQGGHYAPEIGKPSL
jgi:hypothetical protein